MKILLFCIYIFTTLLYADQNDKVCSTSLNSVLSYHHAAKVLQHNVKYKQAIKSFEKSSELAFKSLETCKNSALYNSNMLHDYIISNELQIREIEDIIFNIGISAN